MKTDGDFYDSASLVYIKIPSNFVLFSLHSLVYNFPVFGLILTNVACDGEQNLSE